VEDEAEGPVSAFLLSIGIGPVQEFIAAARKTRDLFYGSWLLSQMSKACARHLREEGADLIFPYSGNLSHDLAASNQDFAVANKIVALVNCREVSDVEKLASECRQAVRHCLITEYGRMEGILADLIDRDEARYDGKLAHKQIGETFEFYAAWQSIEAGGYELAHAIMERTLAARKALRNFDWHDGSNRPKSSLDGFRETVIEHKQGITPKKFFIRTNELLDAVGLLKRMGRARGTKFESTHDIAAESFILKAERKDQKALEAYRRYSRRRADQKEAPFSYSPIYHDEKDDPQELRELVKPLRKLNPATPYYGLFIGDGDSMGKAINGRDQAGQQNLSRGLSNFAQRARSELEKQAEPIFTGGDDVMAFLPLHVALRKAREVNEAFRASMGSFGVTFSAGLLVCHAMDSLKEAVGWAKEAEKIAKSVDDKNALCVMVMPRSGEPITTQGKWTLADDLESIARLYVEGKLTLSLAHEFRALLNQWGDATKETRKRLDIQLPALAAAIARKKETSAEPLRLVKKFSDTEKPRERLDYLTRCLYAARPFARAIKEAEE
jgi:CRISPR-associated protein Cmr2